MRTAGRIVWLLAREFRAVALIAAALVTTAGAALAQAGPPPGTVRIEMESVQVSPTVNGILYRPAPSGQRSSTAVLTMHTFADFSNHFTCRGLARRGFQVLCANGRYTNLAANIDWDNLTLDVKAAVSFLRQQPGVAKVFLLGHSAAGPMMAFYQAVAENGVGVCQDDDKISPCSDTLAGLPRADGLVLLDPTFGDPAIRLVFVDPSVTVEDQFGRIDPSSLDPSLDMFSPDNGFDPVSPTYSEEFISQFYAAQAARLSRLVALAQERLDAIQAGAGLYPDNEPFIIGRQSALLWSFDRRLASHTRGPHLLLTAQGGRQTILTSIRPPGASVFGDPAVANLQYGSGVLGGAFKGDVQTFLKTYSIGATADFLVTEDNITGIDWFSANNTLAGNLAHVRAPLLIVGATGHYWLVPSEIAFNMAGGADKSLAAVEGATHGFTPCTNCGAPASQFGDTIKIALDYLAEWLKAH